MKRILVTRVLILACLLLMLMVDAAFSVSLPIVADASIDELTPDSVASPGYPACTHGKECYDKEDDMKLSPVNSSVGPPMNTLRTLQVCGIILAETRTCSIFSPASYSQHLMSKDCDGTERTTTFLPSDSRACCVMTVTVSSQVRTKWVYRKDDTKGWDVYGEATSDINGTYHVCHYLTIADNPSLPFYPRGWAVEIYLDGNYIGDEYFEITDNGRQYVTCEDVVDSEPVGIKSTFQIGVDPKVSFYLRLYDVAYLSERTWYCHDYLVKWYKPDGSPYWTWGPDGWPDYKDSNPAYDYWLWVAVWGDMTLDSNTPTGQWEIEVYIDQYYDGGWKWYHIATTWFDILPPQNHDPVVSDGYVDPTSGCPDTIFTFRVKYRDQDNDPADTKRLILDDEGIFYFDMYSISGDPLSGQWFEVRVTDIHLDSEVGSHRFFFYFTDGRGGEDYDPDEGWHPGPVVEPCGEPDIDVYPMHLDFNFPGPGFAQNISTGETDCQGCCGNCSCPCDNRTAYPVMRLDDETIQDWVELYNSAPRAYIDQEFTPTAGSFSLLDHLEYVPTERDQGSCGNCWVWAGTGILEIALDVQEVIKDRLSVQYFTSCWHGGTAYDWACCGGTLGWFTDWYQAKGFVIPWSNTNAHWQDKYKTCADGTSVPCHTISTSPSYQLSHCTEETIETHDVGQTQDIANVKNVLHQNKAVWFAFFLPNNADWNTFFNFWNNEPESAIWNPDYSCGHTWVSDEGAGHAVLCVGYDDTDPENSYWIMVNSWGTSGGDRPNGIFHVDMDMNYDCWLNDFGYSLYWQTLDVDFDVGCQPVTISNTGSADLEVTSVQCDQSWLSMSPPCPPSFIVPPGESQTVSVCADPTGLDVGVYYGNMRIYSNDPNENPVTVTVTLYVECIQCTVTFYTDPSTIGSITFGDETYTNGQSESFDCSTSGPATANAPSCWTFDHWETTGNVQVSSTTANPTTVTINCGGTLKAVFESIQCQVTFYTDPSTIGSVTFAGKTYTNGQSDNFDCGTTGPATANAPDCWVFDHWDISGNVSVSDIKANPTTVTIKCGGDLKAVFKRIECQVTFYTDPDNGTITFCDVTYTNNQTDVFYCGTIDLATANPPEDWIFSHWEVGGNVYVANHTANPTNVTIKCGGLLRAVFNYTIPECNVTFYTDPSDTGSISFEGREYTNGESVSFKNGTSGSATANVPDCWTFDHWETSGNVSVSDAYANPTMFTINCGGNLTAVFKRIECEVTFYTDPSNGSITFKGKTYTNNQTDIFYCDTSGLATANAPEGWNFSYWEVGGNVTVSDAKANPTNVTIKCGGTLTAVFKSAPTLFLDPSEIVGQNIGKNFTLTLRLDSVTDLVMWVVDIEWDLTKLELQGLPVEGACLKCAGKPTTMLWASIVPGKITDLTCVILGFVPGGGVNVPPCPDDLANFTFKVLNYTCYVGTWINITFSQLDDSYLNEIEHTTANAKLTLCPCDLFATIQMPCYPEPMLYANVTEYPIKITIFNNGSADAGPFNTCFSACLKGYCFFNKTRIPGVEAGKNVTVLIHFRPKHKGMYNVTVTVDCDYEVAESNENNNKLTLNVEVRIGGDISGDDMVDHKDLLLLASAYGCKRGDAFYIPEADFDCDGKVDHKDLLILAANYGKEI